MLGNVFDIQRLSLHDGPGIRTTVFFKGCPLRCIWCHNPESQSPEASVAFYPDKCIGCGACYEICPQKCRVTDEKENADKGVTNTRVFRRDLCNKCAACANVCSFGALELLGYRISTDDILKEVLRDKNFYKNSGGGLTVSGGEPLMQSGFLLELLKKAKDVGIHTCVETSGFALSDAISAIVPYTDIFLFDIKETDDSLHREFTGVPFDPILKNLRLIDSLGAKIILRLPIVPGKNMREEHFSRLAELASKLSGLTEINVMAYHTLGAPKYAALDLQDKMEGALTMTAAEKEEAIAKITERLLSLGKCVPVK